MSHGSNDVVSPGPCVNEALQTRGTLVKTTAVVTMSKLTISRFPHPLQQEHQVKVTLVVKPVEILVLKDQFMQELCGH